MAAIHASNELVFELLKLANYARGIAQTPPGPDGGVHLDELFLVQLRGIVEKIDAEIAACTVAEPASKAGESPS